MGMTTDQQIEQAEGLFRKLTGVSRSEWLKWMRFYEENGREKAVSLAKGISNSTQFRENQKKHYATIAKAVESLRAEFDALSRTEQLLVFGYVGYMLQRREQQQVGGQRGGRPGGRGSSGQQGRQQRF